MARAVALTAALVATTSGCSGSPDAAGPLPDAGAPLPSVQAPAASTPATAQEPRPPLERLAAGTGAALDWPEHEPGDRMLMQLAVVVPCGDGAPEPPSTPAPPATASDSGVELEADGDAEPPALEGEAAAVPAAPAAASASPTCALRLTIAAQLLTVEGEVQTWEVAVRTVESLALAHATAPGRRALQQLARRHGRLRVTLHPPERALEAGPFAAVEWTPGSSASTRGGAAAASPAPLVAAVDGWIARAVPLFAAPRPPGPYATGDRWRWQPPALAAADPDAPAEPALAWLIELAGPSAPPDAGPAAPVWTARVVSAGASAAQPPDAELAEFVATVRPGPVRLGAADRVAMTGHAVQGGLLFGTAPPGSKVYAKGRAVRVSAEGHFVLGLARTAGPIARYVVRTPEGGRIEHTIDVAARTFAPEEIEGLPEDMVDLDRQTRRDLAKHRRAIDKARNVDSELLHFREPFRWPVRGTITSTYGRERTLNGEPSGVHWGVDIGAPKGRPVVTPAGGSVVYVANAVPLAGATVIVDHGHGLTSSFLHLSAITVRVGDVLAAGDVIGKVGSSGRSTGAHLDWRMNLRNTRVDPALLVDPSAREGDAVDPSQAAPVRRAAPTPEPAAEPAGEPAAEPAAEPLP